MDDFEVEVNPEVIMSAVKGKDDQLFERIAKRVRKTWIVDVDVSTIINDIEVLWHDTTNGKSGGFSILHPPFYRSDLEILLPDIIRLNAWIKGTLLVSYHAKIAPRHSRQSTQPIFFDTSSNVLPFL